MLIWLVPAQAFCQASGGMAYIQNTFPQLTNLYKPELQQCKTHYIFAIDVSGSMTKYDESVTPALQAFAKALPVGEQVSVIPFGATAKENTPSMCVDIKSSDQISTLTSALTSLYKNPSYDNVFKRNTDVNKAVEAVNNAILNNQEAQMNVIVIITDFLSDLAGQGEVPLKNEQLETLRKNFDNASKGKYTRVEAMRLPPAGSGKGYCLEQLQNNTFQNCNTPTKRFEIIDVIKDQSAITHWFEQMSREIMTEKLRAVIRLDNEKNLNPKLETRIDFDGNTVADIEWTPNKLYNTIKLGATETDTISDYVFKNNEAAWQETDNVVITELKLGKLEHKKYGLRRFNEVLNIGMTLPTPYDEELTRLSIEKPIPGTSENKEGWLWTFFIPFWWTIGILVVLIIYIILVCKSAARNASERFEGKVELFDSRGRDIGDEIKVKAKPSQTLLIGGNGNCGCTLDSAVWTIKVEKIKPLALLFWKKPCFRWSAQSGYVCDGRNKKNGLIGRYEADGVKSRAFVDCGSGSNSNIITHQVKISINR